MTAAGHAALEGELRHRIRIEQPDLVRRIQQAIADDPNLVENSEYQVALAEQSVNQARVAELEDKLARAEIVDVSKLSGDVVKFGATVTLVDEDTGEKRIWQSEPEADASKRKISIGSPIAKALIGKHKGASVEVQTPGGVKAYRVRQVEWLEDKQDNQRHARNRH
jgi:transcription elongation factor GreA